MCILIVSTSMPSIWQGLLRKCKVYLSITEQNTLPTERCSSRPVSLLSSHYNATVHIATEALVFLLAPGNPTMAVNVLW